MKELFSLRTVRKKVLMLSKLAGIALIFSYILSTGLPVSKDASLLIWLGFVLLLVFGIDFFMDRFITKPMSMLTLPQSAWQNWIFPPLVTLLQPMNLGSCLSA